MMNFGAPKMGSMPRPQPQMQQRLAAPPANQYAVRPPQKMGMGMGAARPNMMAMSDRESKAKIEKLNAKNEALMAALDSASQDQSAQGNLPPTQYPKLPSHTSFAPADRVAAQNVGIQAATQPPAPPPQAMQMNPQQQNFGRSANPAFNVGGGMPDLSALDEAYRRQSQGG